MLDLRVENIRVQFDHDGDRHFNKAGMIDWHGKPVLILAGPYTFHFDLEGRIQRIDGFPSPHSWDWVQRTMANDWIYYDKAWQLGPLPQSSGIIRDSAWPVNGRSDLPILQGHKGALRDYVQEALDALKELVTSIRDVARRKPEVTAESGEPARAADADRLWDFLAKVDRNDADRLQEIADELAEIRGNMNVLPPDTIAVDYRVLLIRVMDGCTNACGFCVARGESPFALRSKDDIDRQIDATTEVYGADIYNHNSVVLGECDALASPLVEYAAERAFDVFRCRSSYHFGSNLFLFTTNRTLCELSDRTFDMLEALPFTSVYINVGWEAATDRALAELQKQQTAAEVIQGLERAGQLNTKFEKVRISGNFITRDGCESGAIIDALRRTSYRGQLYLSPLRGQCSSAQALKDLHALRNALPDVRVHLYTMQRM